MPRVPSYSQSICNESIQFTHFLFQAVAREDKGILGKDWNKSPKAYFRTNKNSPTHQSLFPNLETPDKKTVDHHAVR